MCRRRYAWTEEGGEGKFLKDIQTGGRAARDSSEVFSGSIRATGQLRLEGAGPKPGNCHCFGLMDIGIDIRQRKHERPSSRSVTAFRTEAEEFQLVGDVGEAVLARQGSFDFHRETTLDFNDS